METLWHRKHLWKALSSLVVLVDTENVSEGVRSSGGVWVGEIVECTEVCCELMV